MGRESSPQIEENNDKERTKKRKRKTTQGLEKGKRDYKKKKGSVLT